MFKTSVANHLAVIFASSLVCAAMANWFYREKPWSPPPVDQAHAAVWVARLKNPDPDIRYDARLKVISLGEPAVPLLIELLDGDNEDGKFEATVALCAIPSDTRAAAIPAFIQIVKNGGPEIQRAAIETLGSIGRPARAAAADFRAMVRGCKARGEKKSRALNSIPAALARIQGDEAVELLIEIMHDSEFPLEAVLALGEIGPSAHAALPSLRAKIRHAEPELRLAIEEAVAKIEWGQRSKVIQ
jgi:HEAT repeat protein